METLEKSVAAKQDTRRSQWKSLKCYSYSRMLSASREGEGFYQSIGLGCLILPETCVQLPPDRALLVYWLRHSIVFQSQLGIGRNGSSSIGNNLPECS